MKKLLLSLLTILTLTVGVAFGETTIKDSYSFTINNSNSDNYVQVHVRYEDETYASSTTIGGRSLIGGSYKMWWFGDKTAYVTVQPITGVHGPTTYKIGPYGWQNLRVDYSGWSSWTKRNEYESGNSVLNAMKDAEKKGTYTIKPWVNPFLDQRVDAPAGGNLIGEFNPRLGR